MPPIKAIEQAQFGGVDSRSNPVNMPLQRWIQCRNWRPRPDGHMELREGYMIRVYDQTGGGAAYSLTPYTVSVPDSYLNPPPPNLAYNPTTGFPPPISQVLPNGTRCALYWQKSTPSQAVANISSVACTIQAAGVPELAIYKVDSTARFLLGHNVTVAGVVSDSNTPANFFNGTFPIQAIGPGTITLDLGISTRREANEGKLLPPPVLPQLARTVPSPRLPFQFVVSPTAVQFGYISPNTVYDIAVTLTFEDPQHTGAVGQFLGASLGKSIFTLSGPTGTINLTGGGSLTLNVQVNQPAAGTYTDTLAVDTNLGFIYLNVSATVTAFSVSPSSLTFGSMGANVTASLAVTVTYDDPTGGTVGTITNISLSNTSFTLQGQPPSFPVNLTNGQSINFLVNVFQSSAGTYTADLTITTNVGVYTVPVTATIVAAPGNITVVPPQLSFGNQAVGAAATPATFTITNNSGGTIHLSSPVVANSAFYMVSPPTFPYTMPNGSSLTISMGVTPAIAGPDQGYITINTDDLNFVQLMVNMYVIGTVAAGNVMVVPSSLDFGFQTVGTVLTPQSIVITNNFGTAVSIDSAVMSNPDFVLQNSPLPYIIPNGGTLTLSVGGIPRSSGRDSGTLTLNTNAANFSQLTITLQVNASGSGGSGFPKNYAGTGGTITAVDTTPGPPVPLLVPLTSAAGTAFLPGTFPIKGMPIVSTAPWHYAPGKDGYLYMHNGSDAKFFDGVCFRDIGLPILTTQQAAQIQVAAGFSGPSDSLINAATITWTYGGGTFYSSTSYNFYCAFFDTATNEVAPSGTPLSGNPSSPTQDSASVQLSGLPVPPDANNVKLIGVNNGTGGGGAFLTVNAETPGAAQVFNGSMSASGDTVTVNTNIANNSHAPHGLVSGDVVAIDEPSEVMGAWPSSGPFAVSVTGPYTFSFKLPTGAQASAYNAEVTFGHLLALPAATTSVTLFEPATLSYQGISQSSNGVLQLPYIEAIAAQLLPASTIGGAQPGYQFYASIYNVITGHVGNRVPIGVRIRNTGNATINITGLPNFTLPSTAIQDSQGRIPTILLPTSDPEWRILIGRTGDGGEVPYACIDSQGNWIVTTSPSQATLDATSGEIDSNSELPYNNYPPPRSHLTPSTQESFANFWREGDRMCGTLKDSPFVYRSASELDSTTGIFVGDPAQAWDPAKIETFPSTQPVIGGFGNMQESWVYTRDELAQLSELSGQVSWNGPYNNFGIIGPWAFDNGWMALPFWVSHSRELCTMMPDGNGPIVISTEYERGLLSRIGDEFDALGNPLGFMDKTEVVYFRDPTRMLEVLRIKCVDNNGNPFTVIHDFNLRDDASPYGQGYEEDFLGPLSIDHQQVYIRDSMALPRVWAAAADGQIYQFYTGGLDNVDYYDGTVGEAFTADAIALRYMGGERTVARTLEWYGDDKILWYIFENMLNVQPDSNYWVNLTFDMRPFPGDAQAAHYIADLQRPEMIHCYLWAQLQAHTKDAVDPLNPMDLNDPPHIPLEVYGRLYLAAPWLGGSRGR